MNARDAIPNDFFEDKREGLIAGQSGKPLCIGFEINSTSVCAKGSIVTELFRLAANKMTGLVNIVDLQFPSTENSGPAQGGIDSPTPRDGTGDPTSSNVL